MSQFVARNGIIALNNSQVTGSLGVSGSSIFTGSLTVAGDNAGFTRIGSAGIGGNLGGIAFNDSVYNIAGQIDGALVLNYAIGTSLLFRRNNSTVMIIDDNANVGIGKTSPSAKLDVSGNALISGSLAVTQGITGSLFGTSSWANNAISASWAPVAGTTVFPFSGSAIITGSLTLVNAAFSSTGSTQWQYGYTASISSSTNIVSSLSTGSFRGAFYNYVATSGSNARAGQISSVWFNNTCSFAEYITTDIGTTSNLDMIVRISGSFVQLVAAVNQASWIIDTSVNLV